MTPITALGSRYGIQGALGRSVKRASSVSSIPLPDAAFSFVPFSIYDDGDGTFSTGTFNLLSHANITVAKTYYVSTTGNDSNDGLTWETALRKPSTALAKSDVDRIYIAAGHYGWGQSIGLGSTTRDVVVVGVGNVYMSADLRIGGYIGTFSAVDNHYEANFPSGAPVADLYDLTQTDANGNYLKYTLKANAEEVDAAASSFYFNLSTDRIAVRTTDDRAPDASLVYAYGFSIGKTTTKKTYIENIKWIGTISSTYTGTGSRLFMKDCLMDGGGFVFTNPTEIILQNVTITRTPDDGIRLNGGNMIHIDCNIHHCGLASASNSSSCHGGYPVIVNGNYSYSFGRPIHDIGLGKAWYLGVHAHHAGTSTYPNFMAGGRSSDYFETWCDQCVSSDSDYDFAATLPAKLHKHNCTGDATDTGDGVDNYDY